MDERMVYSISKLDPGKIKRIMGELTASLADELCHLGIIKSTIEDESESELIDLLIVPESVEIKIKEDYDKREILVDFTIFDNYEEIHHIIASVCRVFSDAHSRELRLLAG